MKWRPIGLGLALSALLAAAAAGRFAPALATLWLGPLPLAGIEETSVLALDRSGGILRAFTTAHGRWRLPVTPEDTDPRYRSLLLFAEDKRFEKHGGADILALARAVLQFLRHGRAVSGGSTLTMQTARLIAGDQSHTFMAKVQQIARAWQLESRFSKSEILRHYLTLAPMGGNIEGVRAASLAYFGKEPRRLSLAESALLVVLPQAPEARRPDRFPEAARRARDRLLARAAAQGLIPPAEALAAQAEPVPRARRPFPALAPHLTAAERARRPGERTLRLTLDRGLQERLELLVQSETALAGRKLSAALLAVDNASGEVLAYVGSADPLDADREGANDMVQAVRSPGSALKPFIYGLAFEAGLVHPQTFIADRPTRFGLYRPHNFDGAFKGPVTVREALAHSLNIPAVKTLAAIGPARFLHRLRQAGANPVLPPEVTPSLGLALGGLGIRMWDMAALYTALARGGRTLPLRTRLGADVEPVLLPIGSPAPLLTPAAAWYVTDILKDAPPPAGFAAGAIAYKTGTSYGYRDAWALGYDGRHTVAVWAGRPDGSAVPGLTGRTAAAPLLFAAFARLSPERAPHLPPPPGLLTARNGRLPPPLQRFTGDDGGVGGDKRFFEPGVSLAFPPDQAEVEAPGTEEPLVLKAEGGVLPLTWLVDGAPLASDPHAREALWQPSGRGFVRISVIDARGRSMSVRVRVR